MRDSSVNLNEKALLKRNTGKLLAEIYENIVEAGICCEYIVRCNEQDIPATFLGMYIYCIQKTNERITVNMPDFDVVCGEVLNLNELDSRISYWQNCMLRATS